MSWSDAIIQQVWEKGEKVSSNDPDKWRKDACGAWIGRISYGNRNSSWGWEVDHIDPDGGDELSNLRPLQWENNLSKSEGRLKCVVTSDGRKNVKKA
jgi:hypothetical protein